MLTLKLFYVFVFSSLFFAFLTNAECDSKKEKNIYTREANEGDFKHPVDNKDENEIDVEVENSEEKKIDPEKAKEVLKSIKKLTGQLNNFFGQTFGALDNAITEIGKAFMNITSEVEEEVVKIEKESGKDLSEVSKTIGYVLKNAKNEFEEYRKIIEEKREKANLEENIVEIDPEVDPKIIIKSEVGKVTKGAGKIKDVLDEIPEKLTLVIGKTKENLREKIDDFEKNLNVDLSRLKSICQKQLDELDSSIGSGLKQTSAVFNMALNTLLGLVSTLQSSLK